MLEFLKINNAKDFAIRTLVTLITIGLITYIFPKEAKFKYDFQKGKPWLHETLFAPFDFSIYKLDDELENEANEIKETAVPYYYYDMNVQEQQLNLFEKIIKEDWNDSKYSSSNGLIQKLFSDNQNSEESEKKKNEHLLIGKTILTSIYQNGIIKIEEFDNMNQENQTIMVQRKKVIEERSLNTILNLQQAIDEIAKQLEVYDDIDTDFMEKHMEDAITFNVFFDEVMTQKVLKEKLSAISLTKGKIQKDESIISRGDIVTNDLYQKLVSLKKEYETQLGGSENYYFIIIGQTLLVTIAILILLMFIAIFRKDISLDNRKFTFILLMVTLMVFMAVSSNAIESLNIYVLPFCILPILIRTFYDTRLATFTHIIAIALIGFVAPNPFEFVFIQFTAGIVAIFSLVNLRKRQQLFTTSFLIFIVYIITYFGISITQEGDIDSVNWGYFRWFGGSAALTLFAYPLMFVFEKLFGFLSDVLLMELSDTNSPLLRKLGEKAPGTMQHSLQVANLAEEAVLHIKGNYLLVRAGALYHDIGKMLKPQFFIENQSGYNPHSELSYEESAKVIIEHVTKGIEMAKKHNLPEQIIDFIRTHHGTSLTWYFYRSHLSEHPDTEVDKDAFKYPGPSPFTKEQAVLMMADAVEAASRSLKSKDAKSLDNLVDKLIDIQTSEHQFENAPITFKNITDTREILKRKLKNIYHVRIEYPEATSSTSTTIESAKEKEHL